VFIMLVMQLPLISLLRDSAKYTPGTNSFLCIMPCPR
jgi:hypothetical protein